MSNDNLQKFRCLLDGEISCLKECAGLASDLKLALKDKDYGDLSNKISEIDSFASEIALLDKDRDDLFSILKAEYELGENASFYDFMDCLDFDNKLILSQLYQTLRLEVLRIQGIFWAINSFVETANESIVFALSSLQSGKFSNVYNRYGSINSSSSEPVLLSKEL